MTLTYEGLARVKAEGEPFVFDPADDLLVHATERYAFGFYDWRGIFGSFQELKELHAARVFNGVAAPHVWIPRPVIVGAAVAGLIVRNPVVTRRFWAGWLK